MLTLPPLTLYVHIPWCVRKCPYCDFNSHEARGDIPEAAYVDALKADLRNDLAFVQGRKLAAIFIGGGTPSLFSTEAIAAILDDAERQIGFAPDIEITLEANPGTFEQVRFAGYRAAGVNRLSLGIQSFDNRHLQELGRIHDRASAITAASRARAAGFENFNLDLMHGLPGQTPAQALADLQLAASLEPLHLSWYQLTIEPNTHFYKQPPVLPDDDNLDDIQNLGQDFLASAGFQQYEVSAYARPGQQSRHNRNYWEFGDYLGIGAGAHGKITLPEKGEILRLNKTRAPADYLARLGNPVAQTASVAEEDLPLEFFMNALRMVDGVPSAFYPERTGLDFAVVAQRWQKLLAQGLVLEPQERLATTALGLRFLNGVLAGFSD